MKLPKLKTIRNKCDALLTPIVKKQNPKCLLCPNSTEVAHHHIHKSKSTRLRYEMENLINLCNACHLRLHCNESYWASRIVEIKGVEWFKALDKKKDELVKADVHFYIQWHEKLIAIYERIEERNPSNGFNYR